ncbi:unnamed protein product [Closterium sp. Naga37s-1]|nr:unnamed protein product [Closterium sp. Naga37s-1]
MLAGFEYPEHECGAAWRDEYAQLYARIRAASRDAWRARQPPAAPRRRLADGSPPGAEPGGADTADAAVRFLTYDWYGSCGGLGDYLIGLVSLFPAALLDRRALLVAQPCMHAAFRSPHIDTALSPDVPMGGRPLLRATPPPLDAAAPAHDGPGDEPQRVEWHAPPCERLEGNLGAAGRDSSAVPCLDLPRHTIEIEALQQLSALSNYRVRYNKGLLITTLLHNQGPWAAALRQLGFKPAAEVWNLLVGMEEQAWGEGVARVAVHVQNDGMTAQNMTAQQLEDLLGKANSTLQCAQNMTQQQLDDLPAKANSTLQCAQSIHLSLVMYFFPFLHSPSPFALALPHTSCSPHALHLPPVRVLHALPTAPLPLVHASPPRALPVGTCAVVATDFIPWHSAQATQHEQHTDLAPDERDAVLRGLQHFWETVAEWVLIASSHSFIIPASGFSRTAAPYALRPLDIYVPPPLNPPKAVENAQKPPPPPSACDPEKPTAIDRFGVTWTGI